MYRTSYSHLAGKVRYISHRGNGLILLYSHLAEQGAVHFFPAQFVVTLFFNENKLRTHTLQARCGTFTLLQFQFLIPNFQPVSPFPKVRKLFVSPSFPLPHSCGATAPQLWCNCPITVVQLPHNCGATEISLEKTKRRRKKMKSHPLSTFVRLARLMQDS